MLIGAKAVLFQVIVTSSDVVGFRSRSNPDRNFLSRAEQPDQKPARRLDRRGMHEKPVSVPQHSNQWQPCGVPGEWCQSTRCSKESVSKSMFAKVIDIIGPLVSISLHSLCSLGRGCTDYLGVLPVPRLSCAQM